MPEADPFQELRVVLRDVTESHGPVFTCEGQPTCDWCGRDLEGDEKPPHRIAECESDDIAECGSDDCLGIKVRAALDKCGRNGGGEDERT